MSPARSPRDAETETGAESEPETGNGKRKAEIRQCITPTEA